MARSGELTVKRMNCKLILALAFSWLFLCGRAYAQAPTVTSITPSSGPVGAVVQIIGTGFGATQGGSTVSLNGTGATSVGWSDTVIHVLVPTGASSGLFSVTVNSQPANSSSFT